MTVKEKLIDLAYRLEYASNFAKAVDAVDQLIMDTTIAGGRGYSRGATSYLRFCISKELKEVKDIILQVEAEG